MAGCSWPRAVGRLLPAAAPGTWAGPGAGVTHWRKGPWEGIPWECWAGHPSLEAHSIVGSQSEGLGTFPRFMAPGWILCWLCSVREAAAPTFPLPPWPGRAQLLHPWLRLFHFFIPPILTLVFPSKLQCWRGTPAHSQGISDSPDLPYRVFLLSPHLPAFACSFQGLSRFLSVCEISASLFRAGSVSRGG